MLNSGAPGAVDRARPAPRYQWIDDMRAAPIPSGPMLAAYALFHFMNAEATCYPSELRLAHETGACERSIRDWLKWLEKHGTIQLTSRPGHSSLIRGRPRSEGWDLEEVTPAAGSTVLRQQLPNTPAAVADEQPKNHPSNNPENLPKDPGIRYRTQRQRRRTA